VGKDSTNFVGDSQRRMGYNATGISVQTSFAAKGPDRRFRNREPAQALYCAAGSAPNSMWS